MTPAIGWILLFLDEPVGLHLGHHETHALVLYLAMEREVCDAERTLPVEKAKCLGLRGGGGIGLPADAADELSDCPAKLLPQL